MQFNALIPELVCSDFQKSKDFYVNVLGFKVEYERLEKKFALLSFQGAQLMLEQQNDHWSTGALEHPYGRGINFQITIDDISPLVESLRIHGHPLFREPEEKWRRNLYKISHAKQESAYSRTRDPA
jgi:catechol 2,3-dioxygenase-like lactoylglutathione lyase family enzyme